MTRSRSKISMAFIVWYAFRKTVRWHTQKFSPAAMLNVVLTVVVVVSLVVPEVSIDASILDPRFKNLTAADISTFSESLRLIVCVVVYPSK